jgi:hypothetical protein
VRHGVPITALSCRLRQGVGMTRKHGTCVLVASRRATSGRPLFDVVANCITIRGSSVGNRRDMAEALAFAADGNVKVDIELQPRRPSIRCRAPGQGLVPRAWCWISGADIGHPFRNAFAGAVLFVDRTHHTPHAQPRHRRA